MTAMVTHLYGISYTISNSLRRLSSKLWATKAHEDVGIGTASLVTHGGGVTPSIWDIHDADIHGISTDTAHIVHVMSARRHSTGGSNW